VVEVGELEDFVRTEDGHGPKFDNALRPRVLGGDAELEPARRFILNIVENMKNAV
jgi:hypothetical protein